jgi:nucleoside-diphosphate-sugar epimerase
MGTEIMVTILVTGAHGFIGRHLCVRLRADGHRLITTSRNPIEGSVTTGNLAEFTGWDAVLRDVDCVIHLAARVHQTDKHAAQDEAAFQRDNVLATKQLLLACERAHIKRFVFLSTIAVMGNDSGDTPYTTHDAQQPFNPYSHSKADAEKLLLNATIDYQIMRIPLVYGAGVKANFLSLMRLATKGIPLPFAAVHNKRSILYVGNLCDAIAYIVTHPTPPQQIVHIADAYSLSTQEIIRHLAEGAGKKARFFFMPPALLGLATRCIGKPELYHKLCGNLELDTTSTTATLGWTPPYDASQVLKNTAADNYSILSR